MDRRQSTVLKAFAVGTSISMTLALLVLGGYFFGRFLGERFGLHPWSEIGFMLLGVVIGFTNIIMVVIRLGKDMDEK